MAFRRVVEVIVGPKGGDGFKITGLKIAFSIEKTDSPDPNKSKIQIYNLSKDTHAKVAIAGNHITLRAGYEDETIAAIFFGDVLSGQRRKDGNDFITELEVFDGRTAVMSGYASVSYAKDVDVITVVEDLLNAMGLPYKGQESIPNGERYQHGYAFIGMAIDGLRDILNKYGLICTVQNEMLYIMKPGEGVEDIGLKLTANTGLLSAPEPVSDKTGDDDEEAEASNRWKFSTLLFPQLLPGAICEVESLTLNSAICISKVVMSGDNWDGDFKIDIEGEVA